MLPCAMASEARAAPRGVISLRFRLGSNLPRPPWCAMLKTPVRTGAVAPAWTVAENLCLPSSGPPTEVATASRTDSRNSWRIVGVGGWLWYAGKPWQRGLTGSVPWFESES